MERACGFCQNGVMNRYLMILWAASAQAAMAQSPMSAAEFDAYTLGKTMFYGFEGRVYGAERHLPNRRVIWSFLDGDCKEGTWYQRDDQICFVYQDRPDPQCWVFTRTGTGLVAQFEGNPEATELYEAQDIGQDMVCYGPEVGV